MFKRSAVRSALSFRPSCEQLEGREVPATFNVTNLNDLGAGSLRDAIDSANMTAGADRITFSVAGTINLASALPAIADVVVMDGTTAPGFATGPLVEVDFNNNSGLTYNAGSEGSVLLSLSLIDSADAGVTLNADGILLVGNYVGVRTDGSTAVANRGGGVQINSSFNNIGIPYQPPNVISGNLGSGIIINGTSANVIRGNYIGSDVTGMVAVPNTANGLLITNGALLNTIGGTANKAKESTELTPGNLISGNAGNGILIEQTSNNNFVASNFIGVNITGIAALPNQGDGVFINQSHFNQIVGTQLGENPFDLPFVYKNVISGNLGNGLRVHDSDFTKIYANFVGLGADNATGVGNQRNGIVIDGTSAFTEHGGVIPLGNVVAANSEHGNVIADQANHTTVFNVFAGAAAFNPMVAVGNGGNGILVTSTGGNNLIRTSISAANGGHGIEISGSATGVTLDEVIVGLTIDLQFNAVSQPNLGDGVHVGGQAHGITIGGFDPSVAPQTTISTNAGHGIAFADTANNNTVFNTVIGLNNNAPAGNGLNGIDFGPNTFNNTIGGTQTGDRNVISSNIGHGIAINGSTGNQIIGNLIGTLLDGAAPAGNGGAGVFSNGSNNLIGDATSNFGNTIANNSGGGVVIASGNGNAIRKNSLYANTGSNIDLSPGANNDQAAPVLTSAVANTASVQVLGSLISVANTAFTLDFFASATGGEGQFYLGSATVTTDASGFAYVRFNGALPSQATADQVTATATDPNGNTSEFSNPVQLVPNPVVQAFAVGAGAGDSPMVNVYNTDASLRFSLAAFDMGFLGGVRVATGDVNNDNVDDIIVAAGPGAGPNVKVFSGVDGTLLSSFFAYGAGFAGGVFVASGDVNDDGFDDIITGAGSGADPHVVVFSGQTGTILWSFEAYDVGFRGGVTVGAADVNGDGIADIVTGAGPGGQSHVNVFDGANLAILQSFFAFDPAIADGVFVAGGNIDGEGPDDILVTIGSTFAGDAATIPQVRVFSGTTIIRDFLAYASAFHGGVRVGSIDVTGDGMDDILTGVGPGAAPHVKIFNGETLAEIDSFFAFDAGFNGGVYVS